MYIAIALIVFLIVERLFPAFKYEKVPFWLCRAISINVLTICSVQIFTLGWNWAAPDLMVIQVSKQMPPPLAALVGFMWATLATYWWHRAMHEYNFLWRWLHQLHHSPRRVDVLNTLYTHPFNVLSLSFLSSLMVHIIGLDTEAIWWFNMILAMISLFTHVNINVPRWIGYFIPTPNMHRLHHEYGKHRSNYSEFVLWDALFGTYRNPGGNPERCGFDMDKELRIGAMLLGKDVHSNNLDNIPKASEF